MKTHVEFETTAGERYLIPRDSVAVMWGDGVPGVKFIHSPGCGRDVSPETAARLRRELLGEDAPDRDRSEQSDEDVLTTLAVFGGPEGLTAEPPARPAVVTGPGVYRGQDGYGYLFAGKTEDGWYCESPDGRRSGRRWSRNGWALDRHLDSLVVERVADVAAWTIPDKWMATPSELAAMRAAAHAAAAPPVPPVALAEPPARPVVLTGPGVYRDATGDGIRIGGKDDRGWYSEDPDGIRSTSFRWTDAGDEVGFGRVIEENCIVERVGDLSLWASPGEWAVDPAALAALAAAAAVADPPVLPKPKPTAVWETKSDGNDNTLHVLLAEEQECAAIGFRVQADRLRLLVSVFSPFGNAGTHWFAPDELDDAKRYAAERAGVVTAENAPCES